MPHRINRESPTEEIVQVVNRLGLVKAAEKLGMPQSTLCTFLKRQGYRRKSQYVKESANAQKFQTA